MILSGYCWSCPFPSPPALLCLFLSSFLAVPTVLHLLKWHMISISNKMCSHWWQKTRIQIKCLCHCPVWNREKDLHGYPERSMNTAWELETPHKAKLRFARRNYASERQKRKAWETAGFWLLHRRWIQGTISRTECDALGGSCWWWSLYGDTAQGWSILKEHATET